MRATLDELAAAGRPLSLPALEPRVSLRRSRLEMMLKVLDVDGAVRRVTGGWTVTGQPWAYDAERYARVAAARDVEQQAMLEYIRTDRVPDELPARAAGRPGAEAVWPLRQLRRPDVAGRRRPGFGASRRRAELDIPGVPFEPRASGRRRCRRWESSCPAGFRPAEKAETGRAVGRLDGIGWGSALRELLQLGRPTARCRCRCGTPWWRCWTAGCRPHLATSADGPGFDVDGRTSNRRQPALAVAAPRRPGWPGIAALPLATSFEAGRPPARRSGGTNSARRLAAVLGRHRLADPAAVCRQRVLLVDDATDTGWTLTVAARELRKAGATAVYPLVLAVR